MAALTAALMSTIDTLINAVSAVAVNDVYKPYLAPNASDKHHLRVARIVSLSAALLGIALVPVFASFKSIYVAHGSFTASITPPMVVTIVLGAYWKKFTPSAAFWTLFGGTMMVALSIAWPVLITPFAHGVDPAGGFKYMRALYGLAASGVIAVLVSCFTRTQSEKSVEGLVVGTLDKAKEKYKGAPANEIEGKKATVTLSVNREIEELSTTRDVANLLSARKGDIVYVSDARRWLGGLRSVHARLSAIHEGDPFEVWISPALIEQGNLILNRKHRIEKII
jgi:Na+/proline symporter